MNMNMNTTNAIQKSKYRTGRFVTSVVFLIMVAILIFFVYVFICGIFEMSELMSDENLEQAPLPGAAALLGVFGTLSFLAAAAALLTPIAVLSAAGFFLALFSINYLPKKWLKVSSIITCSLHGVIMNVFIVGQSLSIFSSKIILEILGA